MSAGSFVSLRYLHSFPDNIKHLGHEVDPGKGLLSRVARPGKHQTFYLT